MTQDDEAILESFNYNKSLPKDYELYVEVGDALREAAIEIINHCPPCADRMAALRCLREARMWANAAINLKGLI